MAWYEVESKVRVDDPEKYREKIKRIAKLKRTVDKTDRYYAIERNGYPKKAFRIRTTGNSKVVNFKKKDKLNSTKEIMVKEEFEFIIKDEKNFLMMMQDLGFRFWIEKKKISEDFVYNKDNNLTIEINKVKELGYFLELEYICNRDKIKLAKERIKEVLNTLDISQDRIDNTGYTKMLWLRNMR